MAACSDKNQSTAKQKLFLKKMFQYILKVVKKDINVL